MTTRLYLIRHGETDYNQQQRLCGWSDPPLNGAGRKQAEAIACSLKSVEFHRIYVSGLRRAIETAEIIRGNKAIEVIHDSNLRELNFGGFEGETMKNIEIVHPDLFQSLRLDSIHFKFPQGESMEEMHLRVSKAIEDIVKQHPDETVLIVAHAGVIRSIVAHLITGDIHKHWSFKIDHCSITVVEAHQDFYILSKLNESIKTTEEE